MEGSKPDVRGGKEISRVIRDWDRQTKREIAAAPATSSSQPFGQGPYRDHCVKDFLMPEKVAGLSPGSPRSLREAWMALAGLSAVFLFEMLDNSLLNVALPTIGRELHASTIALQWVTGAYAVVFGGLMLAFGAIADRFGRRRIMLIGLVLLGVASLATALVFTAEQLIAVRVGMGVAAAMTTPGSMALAFRLFEKDGLRVRAMTLISTVGLVGLAIGPPVGGFVLAIAPWQVLMLVNVPIAVLAIIGVRFGIAADDRGRPPP